MTVKEEYKAYLIGKLFNENFTLDTMITLQESDNSCEEYFKRLLLRRILFYNLTPREEKLMLMKFGISTTEQCSTEYIATELNVTNERIRQIESKVIRKIKHPCFTKEMLCSVTTKKDFEDAIHMYTVKYGNSLQETFDCFLSFFD